MTAPDPGSGAVTARPGKRSRVRLVLGILVFLAALPWTAAPLARIFIGQFSLQTFLSVLVLFAGLLLPLVSVLLRRRGRARRIGYAITLGSLVGLLAGEVLLRKLGSFDSYSESKSSRVTWSLYHPLPHMRAAQRPPWLWRLAGIDPPATGVEGTDEIECRPPEAWSFTSQPCSEYLDSTVEFSFLHRYNSLGLRDEELESAKAPGVYRIVALGDSFTEGAGADQDSTWLKHLERRLNRGAGAGTVETLNAGKSGSDPWFEYVLLERKLLGFEPDLVIVAINGSDLGDVRIRGGMERYRADGTVRYRRAPWWEPLYQISHLVRLVVHSVFGYGTDLMKPEEWDSEMARALEHLIDAVGAFERLARARGFELVIVLHPLQWELESDWWSLAPLASRLQAETGLRVVDLHEYYRGPNGIPEARWRDYYWPVDWHHNARGYEIFARGVAEALIGWELGEPVKNAG